MNDQFFFVCNLFGVGYNIDDARTNESEASLDCFELTFLFVICSDDCTFSIVEDWNVDGVIDMSFCIFPFRAYIDNRQLLPQLKEIVDVNNHSVKIMPGKSINVQLVIIEKIDKS